MKASHHYSFNSSVRFLTVALAIFFAALVVAYEYHDNFGDLTNEELVSENEFNLPISFSSLARTSSGKILKIQRIELVNVFDKVFSINALILFDSHNLPDIKIFNPLFISFFLKSDILKNAP
jgi:hypothetical protein